MTCILRPSPISACVYLRTWTITSEPSVGNIQINYIQQPKFKRNKVHTKSQIRQQGMHNLSMHVNKLSSNNNNNEKIHYNDLVGLKGGVMG